MRNEMIRIIIVEDESALRESLIEYLTLSGFQATGVGSGREFYRALDAGIYDIAIIDIGLPDQSGLVLASYLHTNTNMGVIILTARDSEEDQHNGYEAGADLYLTKPVSSRVLVSAITKLANRLTPQAAPAGAEEGSVEWIIDQSSWTLLTPRNSSVTLTSLELEFLKLLAEYTGNAVNRALLVQRLYPNRTDDYSGRALDALVRRLRDKISRLPTSPNPIKSAYGVGFCFAEPISIR
jgi:DNA-binding response OmpR family regulator